MAEIDEAKLKEDLAAAEARIADILRRADEINAQRQEQSTQARVLAKQMERLEEMTHLSKQQRDRVKRDLDKESQGVKEAFEEFQEKLQGLQSELDDAQAEHGLLKRIESVLKLEEQDDA